MEEVMNALMMLRVLATLGQMHERERWSREQLDTYQARQLREVRKRAYKTSPFYRQFHRGLTEAPLRELPVLTKTMLMEHFDEVVTDPQVKHTDVRAHLATLQGNARFLQRYWVNATSGTTGKQGLFLFNDREWATIIASFARGHEWAGFKVGLTHHMKMAAVASTAPWHMSARIGSTVDSRWMPALRLDAGSPLPAMVAALNTWQPEMLVAYPSMARLLVQEQAAGRLAITPKLIWTGSELLTEETRRRVERTWDHPLFNEYGATECGLLAAEGQLHNGLYLSEDLVIVEVVDHQNQPVPDGTLGDKLLISVLFNHTQPLIRYELSDRVRIATGADTSGRPFRRIAAIEGRAEEVLHFPAITGTAIAVHPVFFHHHLDMLPVGGWQVVQEPQVLLLCFSGIQHEFDEVALVQAVRQGLEAQGVVVPVVVQRVAFLQRNAAGKVPLIVSKLAALVPAAQEG
jgi:phenylacetate-CoA ligase